MALEHAEPSGRPADPRIERSRRVIRQAALAELAEAGFGGFSIESVATRAGVGKSTIYRLWGRKLPLIADALDTLNEQPAPPVSATTARERVRQLLTHLADVFTDSVYASCVPALVEAAEQDGTVRDFFRDYSTRRRQALVTAIADGVAAGEFPDRTDPELASLALSGPIFYCRLVTGTPFDAAEVPDLMRTVLD